MQPFKYLAGIIFYTLLSCSSQSQKIKPNGIITIKGIIKNFPAKEVYFVNPYQWMTPLDSATVIDGKFELKINGNNYNSTYLAAIEYKNLQGKLALISIHNDIITYKGQNCCITGFLLDTDMMKITGNLNDARNCVELEAGRENKPFFATQMMNFGNYDKSSANSVAQLNLFSQTIRQYPYSVYLMEQLYDNRGSYSKTELKGLIRLFSNTSLQNNPIGMKLKTYTSRLNDSIIIAPTLSFSDNKNISQKLLDTAAKLNMVIIWASWCSPCISEIPSLKNIYAEFGHKGLHMVSVSIDTDKPAWLSILKKQQLGWTQLIGNSDNIGELFGSGSIPVVVFIDKHGKEIAQFVGYKEENSTQFQHIINKNLD